MLAFVNFCLSESLNTDFMPTPANFLAPIAMRASLRESVGVFSVVSILSLKTRPQSSDLMLSLPQLRKDSAIGWPEWRFPKEPLPCRPGDDLPVEEVSRMSLCNRPFDGGGRFLSARQSLFFVYISLFPRAAELLYAAPFRSSCFNTPSTFSCVPHLCPLPPKASFLPCMRTRTRDRRPLFFRRPLAQTVARNLWYQCSHRPIGRSTVTNFIFPSLFF